MTNEIFEKIVKGSFEKRFFNLISEFGVEKIVVEYSGGGDSGGVDFIDIVYKNNEDKNKYVESIIKDNFEDYLSGPIYSRHGGFADGGGFSVSGRVIWDSQKETIIMQGTDHHYEYNENGEDEESTYNDWEEIVYSNDEYDDRYDYEFLGYYLQIHSCEIPKEIYNRILAEAIGGNESAKYFISQL